MPLVRSEGRRGAPLGWLVLAVAVAAPVVRTIDVLLVLFFAVILAVYLDAIADFLRRVLGVPPTLGLAAGVLLIGKLFGLAGLVVAVPILVLVLVLVRHILLGEVYGDGA